MTNVTQIETTDYIHPTGNFMRSLKTIRTEDHDHWTQAAIQAEHAWQVVKAEALGRIAERAPYAAELDENIGFIEDNLNVCGDMNSFVYEFERGTAMLERIMDQGGK